MAVDRVDLGVGPRGRGTAAVVDMGSPGLGVGPGLGKAAGHLDSLKKTDIFN